MRHRGPPQFPVIATGLLLLGAIACSHNQSMSGTTSGAVVATPTGGYAVETFSTSATIVAIDAANRQVTLQTPDGKKTKFKASAQMANFGQLKVGDQVNAEVTEEVAVALWKGNNPPPDAAAGLVALSPQGASNPAGVMVSTVQMTATITALDVAKRKVTLQLQDGSSKTIKVDKGVDLSQAQVGDRVTIVATEGAAISITKAG
jgi:hypothetical protein